MSSALLEKLLRVLDRIALGKAVARPEHQQTGYAGEEAAYFYLRKQGYVIVARNFRARNKSGEIDIIGWDGPMLCFVEVKTRSARALMPAEVAVDHDKRHAISRVAREYLRRSESRPVTRFDIVSVYFDDTGSPEIKLFKNAFPLT